MLLGKDVRFRLIYKKRQAFLSLIKRNYNYLYHEIRFIIKVDDIHVQLTNEK